MQSQKILTIEELTKIIEPMHHDGKAIVLSHGDFDLLHIGHIRHLKIAKSRGDILIVTITPDRYVNKGPHRPIFNEVMRAEAVASLEFVDFVVVNSWESAIEVIRLIKPKVFAKGTNTRNPQFYVPERIRAEEQAVKDVCGEMLFTEDIKFSSSGLINRFFPVFPQEVSDFLPTFTTNHSIEEIFGYLDGLQKQKVLTIGETIIDEYQYCQTLGKSGKEPILAAQYISMEVFAGGILAVANNVATFCDAVGVMSLLGDQNSYEDFVHEKLNPRIKTHFHVQANAPTITKRRFVESYPFQKLFEIYEMNDQISDECNGKLCSDLSSLLKEYDVVVVTDYGHGMITEEVMDILCSQSRFLAINTQTNAANRGFNMVSKYSRADYICVSEMELRLVAHNRQRDLREIVLDVSEKMQCPYILVTRGSQGNLAYDREVGFVESPALVGNVADRVGSGDAVLAVTSPCVAQGVPMDIVGFIGNVVGAQAVASVGHREYLNRDSLYQFIQSLLR